MAWSRPRDDIRPCRNRTVGRYRSRWVGLRFGHRTRTAGQRDLRPAARRPSGGMPGGDGAGNRIDAVVRQELIRPSGPRAWRSFCVWAREGRVLSGRGTSRVRTDRRPTPPLCPRARPVRAVFHRTGWWRSHVRSERPMFHTTDASSVVRSVRTPRVPAWARGRAVPAPPRAGHPPNRTRYSPSGPSSRPIAHAITDTVNHTVPIRIRARPAKNIRCGPVLDSGSSAYWRKRARFFAFDFEKKS